MSAGRPVGSDFPRSPRSPRRTLGIANDHGENMGFEWRQDASKRPSHMNDDSIAQLTESFSLLHSGDDEQMVESHNSIGFELGYLPPDQRPGLPGELLSQLADPEIEEDTEAAEALRANANVKVRKVGKVARSLNAQSVRRLVKRATLRSKSGNMRGKPPRIPPGRTSTVEDPTTAVLAILEEDEDAMGDEASESSRDLQSIAEDEDDPLVAVGPNIKIASPEDRHKKVGAKKDGHLSMGPATEAEARAKHARHSSILDEAKAEVVAATMEAGRKCKYVTYRRCLFDNSKRQDQHTYLAVTVLQSLELSTHTTCFRFNGGERKRREEERKAGSHT